MEEKQGYLELDFETFLILVVVVAIFVGIFFFFSANDGLKYKIYYNYCDDKTCSEIPSENIFDSSPYYSINYSVEYAEKIKNEYNISFKDECEHYYGRYFELKDNLYCELYNQSPVTTLNLLNSSWIDNNCELISPRPYIFTKNYWCFEKYEVISRIW